MLILNSPNNPSGTNNEDLEKIASVCKKNKIIVISDEIYSELTLRFVDNSLNNNLIIK